jgi:hypothetical protein
MSWIAAPDFLPGVARAMKDSSYRMAIQVAGALCAALVLYLAAYGPAWSVAVRFPSAAPILGTVYQPLPKTLQGGLLRLWCRVDRRVLDTLNHYD